MTINILDEDKNKDFDSNLNNSDWTTERFKDEFFLDLVKTRCIIMLESLDVIFYRKYYKQAIDIMYRIPLTEQYPDTEMEAVPYIICFKDLSRRVQKEFIDYCKLSNKRQVTILLKEIVIRLFENLDFQYAHSSVMKKLRVAFKQ